MDPKANSLPEASSNDTAQSGEPGIATTSQVQQHEAPLPKVAIQTLEQHGRMLEAIAHHLNFDHEAVVAVQTPESLAAGTSATPAVPSHAASSSVSSTVAANATADSTDASELLPPKRLRLDYQGGEHIDNTVVDHIVQQALPGELVDDMGVKITTKRLSTAFGPFPLMEVSTLPKIHKLILHCRLYPRKVKPAEFNLRLVNTEGFQLFMLPQSGINLSFIQRQGRELQLMLMNLDSLLKENAAVPAPQLCYILMTIVCIPVNLITGPLLGKLFERLTGRQLSSVRVATEKDVQWLSDSDMCTMMKVWIRDLCRFIAIGTQMRELLDMAAKFFEEHSIRCLVDGGMDTIYDEDGTIAMGMLEQDKLNSRLLGIHQDDLPKLYIYLPRMMVGDLGGEVIKRLKQVSYSLINRVD